MRRAGPTLSVMRVFVISSFRHKMKAFNILNSAVINMKEVYQSLTIDIIAKCAFGIEVNRYLAK